VIFFLSALVLLIRLHRFEIPTGADGFFYLKQIESLSAFSGFYYKDYSFAFFLPTVLNFVLHDSLLSFEIAISAVFGGIAWITDRMVTRDWKDPVSLWSFRIASLIFYFYSLMYLELTLVFLKTGTGLFFLLLTCERWQNRKTVMAGLALALAILSHKLMFVFALGLTAAWMFQAGGEKARRFKIWGLPFLVLAAMVILIVHPRLGHHFADAWQKMSWSKFSSENLQRDYSFTLFGALLLLAAAGLIAQIVRTKQVRWANLLLAIGCVLPVFFPDPVNSNSISFRLFLVSAPLFVAALGILLQSSRYEQIFAKFLFLGAILLNLHFDRPLNTWKNPWPKMIPETAELEKVLPKDALLYAPHGAEFYLAYRTPLRPRSFILRRQPDAKTYRLAYVKPYLRAGTLLQNDLEQMKIIKVSKDFYLFKESDWLSLVSLHLFMPNAMNNLEIKPDFIADY